MISRTAHKSGRHCRGKWRDIFCVAVGPHVRNKFGPEGSELVNKLFYGGGGAWKQFMIKYVRATEVTRVRNVHVLSSAQNGTRRDVFQIRAWMTLRTN